MKTIRYDSMVMGGSNSYGILRLSDYMSRQSQNISTTELANKMLNKNKRWIIDGEEVLEQAGSLLELLRELKKDKETFIHLKTNHYDYWFMRSTSATDEILDLCDILTDSHNKTLNLKAMAFTNEIIYMEVS